MTALLLAVLGASFLGSLHCVGMCGGLVALFATRAQTTPLARARAHVAYHLGRLLGYATVGGAAGLAGALIDGASGSLLGVQRTAAVVCGALVLGWGGATLVAELGRSSRLTHAVPLAGLLARLSGRAHRALVGFSPARQALLTGLLTPLLPCGWLWLFALVAAGSGGAPAGATVMAAFWLGSVPALLALGLGLGAVAPRLRARARLFGACGLVLAGALSLAGRGAGIAALPRMEAVAEPAAVASAAPCCCHEGTP